MTGYRLGLDRRILCVLALTASFVLAACAVSSSPTILEPVAAGRLEVVVDSRWDAPISFDVSTPAGVSAILEVRPCELTNMTVQVDPPFAIGHGPIGDRGGRPMPALIASDDLTPVESGYRVLVVVPADGSAPRAQDLIGPSPVRAAGEC